MNLKPREAPVTFDQIGTGDRKELKVMPDLIDKGTDWGVGAQILIDWPH